MTLKTKKLTCGKLTEMINDEIAGSKEYKRYGFNGLARDESRHAKLLRRLKAKMC